MPKITKVQSTPAAKPRTKGCSVLDRIEDISFSEDDGISILIYGMSKTGKTTLAATFPGPILWIVVSGGNKPGELRPLNTSEYLKKVKRVTLEKSEEAKELIAYQAEHNVYKTVVIDHATGLQDLVTAEMLGKRVSTNAAWGDMTIRQYGQRAILVNDIFRDFLGLSCNRVILGQEKQGEQNTDNELVEVPYIGVALQAGIAGWLNSAVDYICQTYKKQKTEQITTKLNGKDFVTEQPTKGTHYCLRIGENAAYTTGFRLPKEYEKPDHIINPDYKQIMQIINGKWKN